MTAFKYIHNGVEITMTDGGKFTATINGEPAIASSVDAMKKRIEKAEVFKPFEAVRLERWNNKLEVFEIVGTRRNRQHYGARVLWLDAKGNTHADVTLNTPENRAAMKALLDYRVESSRIEKERTAAERKLAAKVRTVAVEPRCSECGGYGDAHKMSCGKAKGE